MNFESLLTLHNNLANLDPNEPIAVMCNKGRLVYRQLGKIVIVSGVERLFFPTPDISLGILSPVDFKNLMNNLEKLIQDPELRQGNLETSIYKYGWKVYKLFIGTNTYGPQLYMNMKLVTFKNRWIARWILRGFSTDSKILLKGILNEIKDGKRTSKSNK